MDKLEYNFRVTNTMVAFQLGSACAEGIINVEAARKFISLIDEYKPRGGNVFSAPGDYDDRFGETLMNFNRALYFREVEAFCKENGIGDYGSVSLDREQKAKLKALALNKFVEGVTYEYKKGKVFSLTEFAGCDIANGIYEDSIKDYSEAQQLLTEETKKYLSANESAGEKE